MLFRAEAAPTRMDTGHGAMLLNREDGRRNCLWGERSGFDFGCEFGAEFGRVEFGAEFSVGES